MKKLIKGLVAGTMFLAAAGIASAQTQLTMYYPIAVGGALTKVIDGMIDEFHKANPTIKVNAIYAGNYDETRVRALSAIKGGQPAQLSVLFSIGTKPKSAWPRFTSSKTAAIVLTGIRSADSPNRSMAAICVKLNDGPR